MMSSVETSSSPLEVARTVAADIKLAHSVFALPFALLAAVMAALGPTRGTWFVSGGDGVDPASSYAHPYLHPDYAGTFWPRFAGQLALITVAMVLARTVAMLANRLLDREIDARNPRTAERALPSGRLSAASALAVLVLCAALFMLVCVAFGLLYGNWWPAILGLPVLAWLSAYPLLKRFTFLCHVYLGSCLAISPLAAAIAAYPPPVTDQPFPLASQPALWLLAAMVLCWVAGFDIIYALQDVAVDRKEGLHSMPSRLGERGGLWVSRLLHIVAAGCLIVVALVDERFGVLFAIGVAIVIVLLIVEHATVAKWKTARIALAFFMLNGVISCVLGALGIADVLL
jgi:4-hydroxybenzoate polyprenyltransferase